MLKNGQAVQLGQDKNDNLSIELEKYLNVESILYYPEQKAV